MVDIFAEWSLTSITNAGVGLKRVILEPEAISEFDSMAAGAFETLEAEL